MTAVPLEFLLQASHTQNQPLTVPPTIKPLLQQFFDVNITSIMILLSLSHCLPWTTTTVTPLLFSIFSLLFLSLLWQNANPTPCLLCPQLKLQIYNLMSQISIQEHYPNLSKYILLSAGKTQTKKEYPPFYHQIHQLIAMLCCYINRWIRFKFNPFTCLNPVFHINFSLTRKIFPLTYNK